MRTENAAQRQHNVSLVRQVPGQHDEARLIVKGMRSKKNKIRSSTVNCRMRLSTDVVVDNRLSEVSVDKHSRRQ